MMRNRSLLVVVSLLFLARAAEARLPADATPKRYAITLAPDLKASAFTGEETIEIEIAKATSAITLHAKELTIREARVGRGEKLEPATVRADAANETITLALAAPLQPGPARVSIKFEGKLNDRLRGLYRAREGDRLYALTQFESTDARRAFPCFDEPAMKAKFQLTLLVPAGLQAISNTPIAKRAAEPNRAGIDRVEFAETLPMSTYLVAIAVGEFASKSVEIPHGDGKLPITVWTVPGKEGFSGWALKEAARILPAMEAFFGVPYPYGKLDLIAAPEFMFGGMENVAAILFRDTILLVDEANTTPKYRIRASEVIAHEIAHQWFGDLVTMQWWDDVWLNESFATWMEKKVVGQLHPEWGVWDAFVLGRAEVLRVDEMTDAHPIRLTDEREHGDGSHPTIIYGKGSAVLNMLERWVGEEAFRDGLRRYMKRYAYGNTRAEDLWNALGESAKKPVAMVANRWITQPGHPLVTIERRCTAENHTSVTLTQERFLASGAKSDARWPVPVCLRFKQGDKVQDQCKLFDQPSTTFELPGACVQWLDGNADAAGVYRANYKGATPMAVLRDLVGAPRAALLDDTWALAAAGRVPLASVLEIMEAIGPSAHWELIAAVAAKLGLLERDVVSEAEKKQVSERILKSTFRPALRPLGTKVGKGDDEEVRRARAELVSAIGLFDAESSEVVREARSGAQALEHEPGAVDPSLVDAFVTVAATRNGSKQLWEDYHWRMVSAKAPEDRDRYLAALARFGTPALVERTLALTLSTDLRQEEVDRPIALLMQHRASRAIAWKYLQDNAAAIWKRVSPIGEIRLIGAMSNLCSAADAKAAQAFLAGHPVEGGALHVKMALESINLCAATVEKQKGEVGKWLKTPPVKAVGDLK